MVDRFILMRMDSYCACSRRASGCSAPPTYCRCSDVVTSFCVSSSTYSALYCTSNGALNKAG
ncbi:hypothetical protein BU24DRAFT_88667 [Aaosphaeria arxii CBS 175.79]|uniref:Uncharacterized protein n=1 Tax=Aaosphaeria arxii CBS 175.79 TaxID=1450172 RepID=A0A6A5X7L0_9PLEO|nr:uncharacterized protein BU24DRAFT_88667 [Aaosphaeria arxii CBS 175.79]KAF2008938.1 hypothetical protein BU24DRAFT_88667 [Aaosphaeria arxii CBS 175.79]